MQRHGVLQGGRPTRLCVALLTSPHNLHLAQAHTPAHMLACRRCNGLRRVTVPPHATQKPMYCVKMWLLRAVSCDEGFLFCPVQCSVGGVSYGTGVTEIERAAARREGTPLPAVAAAGASSSCTGEGTLAGSMGLSGSTAAHWDGCAKSGLSIGGGAAQGGGERRQGNGRGGPLGSGQGELQGSAKGPEGSGRPGAISEGEPPRGGGGGPSSSNRAAPHGSGNGPSGSATGVSSGGDGTPGGWGGTLRGSTAAPRCEGAPACSTNGFNFVDARLTGGAWQCEARPALLREFFRVLAVCHTVIPDGTHSDSR